MRRLEITNQKFNSLTVLGDHSTDRNGNRRLNCKCDCGNVKAILQTHVTSGLIKTCGCGQFTSGNKHGQWKGYGEISGSYWHKILTSANGLCGRRKILEMNIDIKYCWELFLYQERKCALSGLIITFPITGNQFNRGNATASLDRIDSSVGYIKGNVQWVHKDINLMKRTYSQEYFINMCGLVANNFGKNNSNNR